MLTLKKFKVDEDFRQLPDFLAVEVIEYEAPAAYRDPHKPTRAGDLRADSSLLRAAGWLVMETDAVVHLAISLDDRGCLGAGLCIPKRAIVRREKVVEWGPSPAKIGERFEEVVRHRMAARNAGEAEHDLARAEDAEATRNMRERNIDQLVAEYPAHARAQARECFERLDALSAGRVDEPEAGEAK